jgi:TIGR03009 family protein
MIDPEPAALARPSLLALRAHIGNDTGSKPMSPLNKLLAIAALAICTSTLFAQQRDPAQPVDLKRASQLAKDQVKKDTDPAPAKRVPTKEEIAKLNDYLEKWEDAMKEVRTLTITCTRKEERKALGFTYSFSGTIHFMKPNRAAMYLVNKDNKDDYDRIVMTDAFVYKFEPHDKLINAYPIKKRLPGKDSEDNISPLIALMKASEAKKRYDLSLTPKKDEDPNYIYVDVLPKTAKDRAEFRRARLVLNRKTFMPRELWYEEPNKDWITYDLKKVIKDEKDLDKRVFERPQLPNDKWKIKQVDRPDGEPAPTKVRSKP